MTVADLPQQVRVAATIEIAVRALAPLVDNAVGHARSAVTVGALVVGRTVEIIVCDDGAGVTGDPEALFAPGNRSSTSSGAGLGLALARRAARTLGGEVRVSSASSPTSFTLTLPCA